MQTAESSADACPLDERQQRRILDGILAGPVVELLGEVVRRLPNGPRRAQDEATYRLEVERRLRPMELDIALTDETGRAGFAWPGSALTGDDQRRLATMENTTQLRTTRLLHHSVRVAHHLFQAIMREIMATSQQTGVSVRDLLTAVSGGNGHAGRVDGRLPPPDAAAQADGDTPGVELSAGLVSAALANAGVDPPECAAPPAVEPDDTADIAPSFPPHLMAKRAAPAGSCEGITDDCVRELEGKMQRLQDTMDTLIGAIDEFRDDVVYTLRNLPDRMPPPLHIHSLPLDPTDADFAGRVNAVPPDVIARLRDEAVQGREAESAPVAAAEGNPSPAPMLDETPPDNRRHLARQPRLFA
jgi:diadenosine tetraphosphate (Ap4A) HIT family hydrolase